MYEFIHISVTSNQTQQNVLRLISSQLEKTHSHTHDVNILCKAGKINIGSYFRDIVLKLLS